MQINGLYTDYYELTMAQAFFLRNRHLEEATFDYFYRKAPFSGAYVIFAGAQTLADTLSNFVFDNEAITFLKKQGFDSSFLQWLSDFSLDVSIKMPPEGSIVFPNEPIAEIRGPVSHCMLLETILLNIFNFESLIATKASRMKNVMLPGQKLIDFGLRRAQGFSGLYASRAAIIGGCDTSSNVLSGMVHNHPVGGTHAHSWIQSFPTELEAFQAYSETYPDATTLLVDTYDTLESGILNSIKVAKELEKKGCRLKAVRLDSGDFRQLIPKVRTKLDKAGLEYVKIIVSDNIDEYKINDLNSGEVKADIFGVGTRLITGYDSPALNGVYKMSSLNGEPVIKRSDDTSKISLPGSKKVYRFINNELFSHDIVQTSSEEKPKDAHELHSVFWKSGEPYPKENLDQIKSRVKQQKLKLAPSLLRLEECGQYSIEISAQLQILQKEMLSGI